MSRGVQERLAVPFRAAVLGVQRRACHLRLDSGALLVLAASEVPLAPNGIAVEVAPEGVRVGQAVALSQDDTGDVSADWLVLLGGAAIWDPRPPVRRVAPSELEGRLRAARAAAIADGARESFLPLLWTADGDTAAARLASLPTRLLREAVVRGDAAAVARAASRLAGLGPGLTPSGDDLLCGFAAAWTLVGESLGLDSAERAGVTRALNAGAEAGASPLGRAWLGHAVRGELPEPMTRFVAALFAAEPRNLVPAARDVLAVGASSGTDWMVGFLLGAGPSWS